MIFLPKHNIMILHKTNNMEKIKFDEQYYENGIKSGISGYENYHYIPTRSIGEALTICKEINFNTVMDFGCAKGFLVHALRLLGKQAIGVDLSEYAIKNCHPSVKDNVHYLTTNMVLTDVINKKVDLLIAKDVLEHIPEDKIPSVLKSFYNVCDKAFLVIPLGDNDSFRIREYEMDKTHVTKKDEEWWINKINESGFKLNKFDYVFGNVKEKWTKSGSLEHKFGNGFFIIEK